MDFGYIPLPAKDLFKMKPGDRFRAYWCKDDNEENCRLNYTVMEVKSNKNGVILCKDEWYSFYEDEIIAPEENILDLYSRGYCYLYKA
jgi:predicted nucleic-acid-binding Zn-ribbon protein